MRSPARGLTILIGIPLGIVSATHNNKLPDHLSRIVSLGGYSIPQFWFGAMLQILLVLYIRISGLGLVSPRTATSRRSARYASRNPGIGHHVHRRPALRRDTLRELRLHLGRPRALCPPSNHPRHNIYRCPDENREVEHGRRPEAGLHTPRKVQGAPREGRHVQARA